MKYSNVYDHRRCSEFSFLIQPCVRLNGSKIDKSQYFSRKDLFMKLSKYLNVKALSPLTFQWKMQLLLASFFFFFILKDQKVTDQVSTTFSEALQSGVTCGEKSGGCRLIPIRSIPALMSFFCFRIPYFDFRCVVWYHTQTNKK